MSLAAISNSPPNYLVKSGVQSAGSPTATASTLPPPVDRTRQKPNKYRADLVLWVCKAKDDHKLGQCKKNLHFSQILKDAQQALKKAPLTSPTYEKISGDLKQQVAELTNEVEQIELGVRTGSPSLPFTASLKSLNNILGFVRRMKEDASFWEEDILREQINSITAPFIKQISKLKLLDPSKRSEIQGEFVRKITYDGGEILKTRSGNLANKFTREMETHRATAQSLITRLNEAIKFAMQRVNAQFRVPLPPPNQSDVIHSPSKPVVTVGDPRVEEAKKKAVDQLTSLIHTKTPEHIEKKFAEYQNLANTILADDAGNDSAKNLKKLNDGIALIANLNTLGGIGIDYFLVDQKAQLQKALKTVSESFKKELSESGLEDSQETGTAALKDAADKITKELEQNAQTFVDKCKALMGRLSKFTAAAPAPAVPVPVPVQALVPLAV